MKNTNKPHTYCFVIWEEGKCGYWEVDKKKDNVAKDIMKNTNRPHSVVSSGKKKNVVTGSWKKMITLQR